MQDTVRIIATGGTIDEVAQTPAGRSHFNDSFVAALLEQGKVTAPFAYEVLMLKDSRDLGESEREIIRKRCEECPERRIILSHGTFTMTDTARYLGERVKNKTIVLTGAAVPAPREGSDAPFNIGYALAAAQQLPTGVYVAMNGRVFPWDDVKKNVTTGIFE